MTHIEIKKYFDKQRDKPMKPSRVKLPDIAKKVFWEKNQYVEHHPEIDRGQIIAKTSTDKFPANATTIRFHSLKNKAATAYFYGKLEPRNYGNSLWTYPSSKLTVTFPNTNPSNGRKAWGYAYQGDLHYNGMSRQEVDVTLDYIEGVMQDFLNL